MHSFLFDITSPQGLLSPWVQAIWSASVPTSEPAVTRRLFADAGSGVLFNLGVPVSVDEEIICQDIMFQTTTTKSHQVRLPPGTNIMGIRFHPGMGELFLNHCEASFSTDSSLQPPAFLYQLLEALTQEHNAKQRIQLLNTALEEQITERFKPPEILKKAMDALEQASDLSSILKLPLSQRQLERQFQHRLGMSPKYYQRLRRVRACLLELKNTPTTNLAILAISFGFSDQAHLTRECRAFTGLTPKQYLKQMR